MPADRLLAKGVVLNLSAAEKTVSKIRMTRRRNARKPAKGRRRRAAVVRVARMPVRRRSGGPSGLSGATAYRKLLVDPCNAPLVPTPYEGPNANTVERYSNIVAAALGNGIWFYHPYFGLFTYQTADATLGGNVTNTGQTPSLDTGRAVAGCIGVTYVGAEATRAGMVYCGVVPGSIVYEKLATAQGGRGLGLLLTTAAAKQTTENRMPVDRCEVNWFPGQADEEFQPSLTYGSASTTTINSAFAGVNFACVLILGAPAASYQVKITGVVERGDLANTNLRPWGVAAPVTPKYSWKSVLTTLTSQDTTWYLDTFRKVAALAGGASMGYATAGLPGALGYLTQAIAGMRLTGKQTTRMAAPG